MRAFGIAALVAIAAVTIAFVSFGAPWRTGPAPYVASENEREPLPAKNSVEVRYIANEGLLISSRDKRVLIDGLHRLYKPAYAYLPDAEREKIEAAKAPFEKIDLILVSHMHGDHFHPESVGLYLKNSPKTIFASSEQVVGEVASKFASYDEVKERITPVTYSFKERATKNLAGIDVEFLSVGHGTDRHATIQNLGHVFTVGGKKFLHLGDAVPTIEIFEHFDLDKLDIDVALVPYWFLTSVDGRKIIREHIKPKHVIAVHVGPDDGDAIKKQIAKEFPDADVFTTMLERRNF